MPRKLILAGLTLSLLAFASFGQARFDLVSGFPWSYSVTGSETASDLEVDFREWVWVVGNVTRPVTGKDILGQIYSITNTGTPISVTAFDWQQGSESAPSISLGRRGNTPEAVIVFDSVLGPASTQVAWLSAGDVSFIHNYVKITGGARIAMADVVRGRSGTPFMAGTFVYADRTASYYSRWPRTSALAWSNGPVAEVTVPASPARFEGRGVVADGSESSWMVAKVEGDLEISRYTTKAFGNFDETWMDRRPETSWRKTYPTSDNDEPWCVERDVLGDIWIAGSRNGVATIWKTNSEGTMAAGFPVAIPGLAASSTLYALVVDSDRRCLAVGECGSDMLFVGVGPAGHVLHSMTVSVTESVDSAAPDRLSGRGLGLKLDGSVWIAATVSSAPLSTAWAGSYTKLFLFKETAPPPPIPAGAVRLRAITALGTGGAVIDVSRGETLEILAHPNQPGTIRAQVMTMRGELIRQFETLATGGVVLSPFVWDGRNGFGDTVASGVYAIRVSGGGLKEVRRAVVIRKR